MPNPCYNGLVITADIPDDQAVAAERLEELNRLRAEFLQMLAPPWFSSLAVEGNTLTADFETRYDPPLRAIRGLALGHPYWKIRFSYVVEDYTTDVSGLLQWDGTTWTEQHTTEYYRQK